MILALYHLHAFIFDGQLYYEAGKDVEKRQQILETSPRPTRLASHFENLLPISTSFKVRLFFSNALPAIAVELTVKNE